MCYIVGRNRQVGDVMIMDEKLSLISGPKKILLHALFFLHDAEHIPEMHMHVGLVELVIVTQGSAVHVINGLRDPIGLGNVFVVRPGEKHGFENPRGLGVYNILFDEKLQNIFADDLAVLPGYQTLFNRKLSPKQSSKYISSLELSHLQEILHEAAFITSADKKSEPGWRTVMLAAFLKLIWLVCKNSRPVSRPEMAVSARICQAIEYMGIHYAEQITLGQLAGQAGMSVSSFRQNFARIMGMPPIEYLLKLRIEAAREMLRFKDLGMIDIAFRSGFQDCNYFARKFKDIVGVTPTQYRREASGRTVSETLLAIASNKEELDEIDRSNRIGGHP